MSDLTRSEVTVRRPGKEYGKRAFLQDVVIKETGEVIGSVKRLTGNGGTAVWDIFDTEGNEINWRSSQTDAVEFLLMLYKKTCSDRGTEVS